MLRQLARPLVDPAVHADLVALVDHPALLVGMPQGDHGGDEDEAGMQWRLRTSRMRGTAIREPYSPCESRPGETEPSRRVGVS